MKRRRTNDIAQSKLVCSVCKAEMFIARRTGKGERKAGHVKHMHCYKCNKTQAFIECDKYGLMPEVSEAELGLEPELTHS